MLETIFWTYMEMGVPYYRYNTIAKRFFFA